MCAVGLILLAAVAAWWVNTGRPSNTVDLRRGLVFAWPQSLSSPGQLAAQPSVTGVVIQRQSPAEELCASFDGTGGVVVPDARQFAIRRNQDFAVSAWIQPEPVNGAPFGIMPILEKRKISGIAAALGFELCLVEGRLTCQLAPKTHIPFKFSDYATLAKAQASWARRRALVPLAFGTFKSPGPDLRDGRLHHVALTLERRSVAGGKLYVDGVVVLTFDPTKYTASLANTDPLLVGVHPDKSLNLHFKGLMKDVRLYRRALSPAEIEALGRTNAPGKIQSLMGTE